MTLVPGIKYKEVGNLYGLRNWVEYGLKQSKNELGWADFRVTDYSQIQKWWEIIMSAYLLVSLHSQVLNNQPKLGINKLTDPVVAKFREHDWWDKGSGWKNLLNNLRLVIQPLIFFNLLKPWRVGLSSFAFIDWLSHTNCIDESNARRYSRQLIF